MTDRNEPPVREALAKNADKVTSDLHIACRAEIERLREVETKSLEAECVAHIETIEQLRAALTEITQGARSLDYAIHLARVALAKQS